MGSLADGRTSGFRGVLVAVLSLLTVAWTGVARAEELVIAPARDGALGAWLVAGPLRATGQKTRFLPIETKIADVADAELQPTAGLEVTPKVRMQLVASSERAIDLTASLKAPQSEAFALAAGILRAKERADLLLVLGGDDGVTVTLDGKELFSRDLGRGARHDDETIPLSIEPGDHRIVLRLHQRSGQWELRARLLDARDLLPPKGVRLVLPGVAPSSAIAAAMASVELELRVASEGYRPRLLVRFPGGLPDSVPVAVRGRASWSAGKSSAARLWDVSIGEVSRSERSALELSADLPEVLPADFGGVDDGTLGVAVEVAGRSFGFERPLSAVVRRTIGRLDEALGGFDAKTHAVTDRAVVRATLEHARERLDELISTGDKDTAATVQEAQEVERFLERWSAGQDPVSTTRGPVRLAYRSPLDGRNHPFALYVPPSYAGAPERKRPLVVALHGLNGKPMTMLRVFFGRDEPGRSSAWKDRHVGKLPDLDAFVVAPSGFGNLGYREAGEIDVIALRDWAVRSFPIDPARVYVTGPSMGGIGTGAVALRYPDKFAAAAPLCGYHSYFLRNDMAGRTLRPWERSLAEFFSNVFWARNGLHTPMYIVHGTRDLPEQNSGVLIDRYKALGYPYEDEHPDKGHDVWIEAYEDFKTFQWLMRHKRDPQPRKVVIETSSLRYADSAWVHITALKNHLAWSSVHATISGKDRIEVTTKEVDALRLDRSTRLSPGPVTVVIDRSTLSFGADEPLELHQAQGAWDKGALAPVEGLSKKRGLSGPIQDAFLEPLVFVYGTRDPSMTRASLEVARALAEPPYGVEARWPVVSDVDLDPALAATHALVLIGNARSNSAIAEIDAQLPIRIEGSSVAVGSKRFAGRNVGTMFIHPNPKQPERYVVVVEAPDAGGLWRSLSLPRLTPDFVVYDDSVAGARGQLVLGRATILSGGSFDSRWRLPEEIDAAAPVAR